MPLVRGSLNTSAAHQQRRMPLAKMRQGTKRCRTQQHDAAQAQPDLPGREQLLFTSPEMQTRVGQRYCDEAQLLPLLLACGLIRRVRTIEVEVRPLGGVRPQD
jgi:hypothetical protein